MFPWKTFLMHFERVRNFPVSTRTLISILLVQFGDLELYRNDQLYISSINPRYCVGYGEGEGDAIARDYAFIILA